MSTDDLASLPLFSGAEPGPLVPILAHCPEHRLTDGHVLLRPGEANRSLYLVLHGRLRIHVGAEDGDRLNTLEAGACVGDVSMIEEQPATAFVIADGATRVLEIPVERFWNLVAAAPAVARNLMKVQAARLRSNTDQLRQELELKRAHAVIDAQRAELARHAESLERTVGERTAELEASRRQLEAQQKELQQAYVEIETANGRLEQRLTDKRWIRRSALLAVAVVVIGLGLHLGLDGALRSNAGGGVVTRADAATARTVPVATREVRDWLSLRGTVQPTRWVEVPSPLNSVVTGIHFRYGELVEEGQLLLELDTAEQRSRERDAHTQLIKAQQEVDRLRNWADGAEVRRARRELGQAQDALKEAQRTLQSSRRLFDKGIISGGELHGEEAALADRKLAVVASRESLEATLAQGGEDNLRVAELELANARQAHDEIRRQLDEAVVRSPATGILFPSAHAETAATAAAAAGEKALNVGSPVAANQAMFAIADMQGLALESDVAEAEVLKLAAGQPATVTLSALPGVALAAKIESIAGRGSVDSRGDSTFKVRAVVAKLSREQRRAVRLGMSAEARVEVYHKADALVVPFAAVTVKDGSYHVEVLRPDGTPERRDIEVRGTLVDGVEVASGLAAGDRLLLSGG
ncbi:cyclic nucleotide-binding domain-containing protein [Endothiovibrio diazotrophicus]